MGATKNIAEQAVQARARCGRSIGSSVRRTEAQVVARVARVFTGNYNTRMARSQDHLTELLKLPSEGRAKAARALLDSLDEDGTDGAAEEAQVAELVRRMQSLDAGEITLVNGAEARARVKARLKLGGK